MHPASHNTGTDNKFLFISGNICAFLASAETSGIINSFVALDDIVDKLAQITLIGSWGLFFPFSSLLKKCPVAAVSGCTFAGFVVRFNNSNLFVLLVRFITAIAYDTFFLVVLGEDATVTLIFLLSLVLLLLVLVVSVILRWFFSPRRQLLPLFFGFVNGLPMAS